MKIFKADVPLGKFAPALVLVFNSLTWYSLIFAAFEKLSLSMTETFILYGVYYVGIAVAALAGASYFHRSREKYLLLWMLFGVIMTTLLATIQSGNFTLNLLVFIFLGFSIGAGLPSSLAYFADTTKVENRGTYGGITWCTVGFGILAMASVIGVLDLFQTSILLALWRIAGLISFFILTRRREELEQPTAVSSYHSILQRQDVILYLLPWIMFSLVNFAESPILGKLLGDFQLFAGFIEFAVTGVFAIVGGIIADTVGRKRVVITGFIIVGVEYAMLSLFSGIKASWYVYTVLDGIAWGLFASVFFMTLWADLSEGRRKEKYYALGGLPYLLAGYLPVLVKPFIEGIETVAAFSLASFFLFLAVLPLMYAPETLPEKRIKEREFKGYVEKAKKIKEKYD